MPTLHKCQPMLESPSAASADYPRRAGFSEAPMLRLLRGVYPLFSALTPGLAARMATLARRIYRALLLTGYARIDVRLKPDGSVFVLEANANPNLEKEEDFATSAKASGVGYEQLLERIMRSGMGYEAAWRQNS